MKNLGQKPLIVAEREIWPLGQKKCAEANPRASGKLSGPDQQLQGQDTFFMT